MCHAGQSELQMLGLNKSKRELVSLVAELNMESMATQLGVFLKMNIFVLSGL